MPNAQGPGAQGAQTYYNSQTNFGNYQFISLDDIIDNFQAAYVGENKILPNILSGDISFHAHRALQELNYDTLRSVKSLEIEVCPSLKVPLPHDFVNHVKFAWVDTNGIERVIYPATKTSNPFAAQQDTDCEDCKDTSSTYDFTQGENITEQEIACADEDVSCEFNEPAVAGLDVSHKGATNIVQYITGNPGAFPTHVDEKNYFNLWISAVDNLCFCLQNAGVADNCGENLGWGNFFTDPTGTQERYPSGGGPDQGAYTWNTMAQMTSSAGWSNLRATDLSLPFNRKVAVNGLWPTGLTGTVTLSSPSSNSWDNFKGNQGITFDHTVDTTLMGKRYGLDTQFAQANGSYFIDYERGMVHFGGSLSGKTVVIKYISDGVSDEGEIIVPKLAEEAMYKWIAYGCAQARTDVPPPVVARLKQEKFAETRKAKIRLSNIKIEEISQMMRAKSKFIDH